MTLGYEDLRQRVDTLTLEQKVRLLTGADFWALHDEPDAGLRRLVTSDGPAGVRGELWDERDPSANIPSPTALAASWDPDLLEELGGLLASEARRKGVDVVLAPTVNLHRSPYGGRHFECLSEDPVLTGATGSALVRGLQSAGVGATVKHFVGNDSETDRYTADMRIDERTLRELYLAPFEVIVTRAGAWSVMAAYNGVNGHSMTQSPMLRSILQQEWGFDGVTMSDWYAGRTLAAAEGALDLVMPGPTGPWGDALVDAVRGGQVPLEAVDDKVLRILRLAARVGALDGVPVETSAPASTPAATQELLRRAASAGFVLVRNEPVDGAAMLPLAAEALRQVAVLGPSAQHGRTLGGGSAFVFADRSVSPLEGVTDALGDDVEVVFAPGVRAHTRIALADPADLRTPDGASIGVELRFLDADGVVLGTDVRAGAAYNWNNAFGDVPRERLASIELRTRYIAAGEGEHRIGTSGLGRFAMSVSGSPAFDERLELPPDADPVEGLMRPPQRSVDVRLEAGAVADIVLIHTLPDRAPDADVLVAFQLNVDPPQRDDDVEIEHAVALARASDVAVVVVGTNEEVESEGFDRDSLALPGRQDELVHAVAAANSRTVVVVNAGAPILMPWRDEVAAVLLAWFPGQEFGGALADVLLGVTEPGGRLPTTWPVDESAPLPSTRPVDGVVEYDEGLHIGYRRFLRDGVEPAYWFGHGLGYTTWAVGSVVAAVVDEGVDLTVDVSNTGDRAGRYLVQVYVSRPDSAIERPVRWLAGHAWAAAEAGRTATVVIGVPRRAFEHWDVDRRGWAREAGAFTVAVAPHAGEVGATTEIVLGE